jgi:hypothetical protein
MFSFAFVYFQEIFRNTASIVEKDLFKTFVSEHYVLISIFVLTIASFFTGQRIVTQTLFFISVSSTFILTSYNLFLEFSKFSLIILFFYLLIAFYFYQFYCVDAEESYYNPQFDNNFLFPPMLKQIDVEISNENKVLAQGYLTNWSEEGCFVYFSEEASLKGKLSVKVLFKEREFIEPAFIVSVTKKKNGYGFKFKSNKKEENLDSLGWSHFYEIIEEMGLKPELLK